MKSKPRCHWLPLDKADYVRYHDTEWGVPVHEDRTLFEMLILEGAQAGLSWYSVLRRREGYRKAFRNFDVARVAEMSDADLAEALAHGNIIRNRLKVLATRKNAQHVVGIQQEFGSFDAYLWGFVKGRPIVTRPRTLQDLRPTSPESDALAKDLKQRGLSFVGSTIMHAYLQAVGLRIDHMADCYKSAKRWTVREAALAEGRLQTQAIMT